MRKSSKPIRIVRKQNDTIPTLSQDFVGCDRVSQSLGANMGRRRLYGSHSRATRTNKIKAISHAGYLAALSYYEPDSEVGAMEDTSSRRTHSRINHVDDEAFEMEEESDGVFSSIKTVFFDGGCSDHSKTPEMDETLAFAAVFLGVDFRTIVLGEDSDSIPSKYLQSTQVQTLAPACDVVDEAEAHRPPGKSLEQGREPQACNWRETPGLEGLRFRNDDARVWTTMYCVLEGGTLYFYRRQRDAETEESYSERCRFKNHCRSGNGSDDHPLSGENVEMLAPHSWRNCVRLSTVNAVRSAEVEFGANSFELTLTDDSTIQGSERVILRAQTSQEMNEWLFQFHRSIASFVLGAMESATVISHAECDPFISEFSRIPIHLEASPPPNLRSLAETLTVSPRCPPLSDLPIGALHTPLSHGHGRSSLHRRRSPSLTIVNVSRGQRHLSSPVSSIPLIPQHTEAYDSEVYRLPSRLSREGASSSSTEPELSAPRSDYPELERPPPSISDYDVPLNLRLNEVLGHSADTSGGAREGTFAPFAPLARGQSTTMYVPPHVRRQGNKFNQAASPPAPSGNGMSHIQSDSESGNWRLEMNDESFLEAEGSFSTPPLSAPFQIKLGGCADPDLVFGSIVDRQYVERKASVLGKARSEPFGATAESTVGKHVAFGWEVGATSVTGIRDSNEDAYLVVGDLLEAFRRIKVAGSDPTVWEPYERAHSPSLFALFDGHCGDQAARFTAEFLLHFLHENSIVLEESSKDMKLPGQVQCLEIMVERAVFDLDRAFCELCVQDGRSWESGTTALVATLFKDHLVIANLGDARGVFCRSVTQEWNPEGSYGNGTWNVLSADSTKSRRCVWSEVTDIHSPSRDDERRRIERANGWVTHEKEIPVGQLKRMALFDQDVVDILKRCVSDHSSVASAPQRIIQISRVCGELAVSRAIGDRDFKAQFNAADDESQLTDEREWDSSALFLPYPNGHSRTFVGDLVSSKPEFRSVRLGEVGSSEEFLLLACDGLWDVMDADDAVRLTRDLLYVKRVSAKLAANRLAELAVHLGSSDNVTVIVLRFYDHM